jgi:hypothetical protein
MYLKMGQDSMVVASTAAAARVFLKTLDINFANRPVDIAPKYLAYGGNDMVFAEYGPKYVLFLHMLSSFLINCTLLYLNLSTTHAYAIRKFSNFYIN